MEHDTLGFFDVQSKYLAKVPGNRLSFAVFIGCEPDVVGGFYGLFKFGNDFTLLRVDFVCSLEAILYVDRGRAVLGLFDD